MITFANLWLLLLLIPVALLGILMACRKRPSVKISTVIPLKKSSGRKKRLTVMEAALLIALALTVIALARPRAPEGTRKHRAQGVDIILAIDMSGSMQCFDRPAGMSEEKFVNEINSSKTLNRLETAKREIRSFIEARPNDRIGLIGFADLAYSFVPPTLDHALLLERLKTLQTGELGDATGIASPIGSAAGHLKKSKSPRRVLVLFTDGANTAQNRVAPQAAAEAAKEFNVVIHTVGIGAENSYAITAPFNQLARVQSMPDIKLLREISAITGGNYYAAADADGMKRVMEEINALEKTDHSNPVPAAYKEYAPMLALIAAGVLMLAIVISSVMRQRLP